MSSPIAIAEVNTELRRSNGIRLKLDPPSELVSLSPSWDERTSLRELTLGGRLLAQTGPNQQKDSEIRPSISSRRAAWWADSTEIYFQKSGRNGRFRLTRRLIGFMFRD